jgi:hypothetical protein
VSYRWLRYVDRQVHPYQYCTPPNTKRAEYAPGSPCRYLEGTGLGMAWTGDVQQRLDKLHRSGRLTTPRGGRVPLFLTEFGYVAYGGNEIPENVRAAWYLLAVDVRDDRYHRRDVTPGNEVPEPYRAKWLPMAMEKAKRVGAKEMVVYQLWSSGPQSPWDTGILDQAGNPLPSFNSLQRWAQRNGYHTKPAL